MMGKGSKNNSNSLIIDDDYHWLSELEKLGYKTIFSYGITHKEIIKKAIDMPGIINIYINLCLLCNESEVRLQYLGIDLIKKLMLEKHVGKWFLLTFEDKKQIFTNNNTQLLKQWKTVQLLDYIYFIKQNEKNTE